MADQLGTPGAPTPEQLPYTPEPQPTTPVAEPPADFSRQVEMYKTNLQQKFGQKALETGVSIMALTANIPALKDISTYIYGTRKVLGTAVAGMLGGDLGKQLGLSKFSAEQGQRIQEYLEKTKQFYNEDGTERTFTADELQAAQELRAEMAEQFKLSTAVAKTTEHHNLFGRMIEEDLDKTSEQSEGWGKETLRGIATGVRGLFSRETLNTAGRLAAKVANPVAVGKASWQLAKAGARNWKRLAWMGAPMAAVWLAPVAAPLVMTATIGMGVGKKVGQMRELYSAHNKAEERVQAYQQFSVAHIPTIRGLAEQMIRLDRAMGKGDPNQNVDLLMAELQQNVSRETYQHIAQAVRQASAEGAGIGLAAGAMMYGVLGHHEAAAHPATPNTEPSHPAEPFTPTYGGPPGSEPATIDGQPHLTPSDNSAPFIHQRPDVSFGKPLPVEDHPSNVTFDPNAPHPPSGHIPTTVHPSNETYKPEVHPHSFENVHAGEHRQIDFEGNGHYTDVKIEKDGHGRLFIKMHQMDTAGDGHNHHLTLTKSDIANHVKEKYVKVFVDHQSANGGYMGQEIHQLATGEQQIARVLWVGDKDEWMRKQVGADNWNHLREQVKGSVGADHHETKGWGFVARRGPMASLESHTQADLRGLTGKTLETAIRNAVPEIQLTTYDDVAKTFSGKWLGHHGFEATFTGATRLPQTQIDALTQGWPTNLKASFEQTPFAFDTSALRPQYFTVPADNLRSFAKALLYSPSGLPMQLTDALRAIHEQKSIASDALLVALRALKKQQFTLADLVHAARMAATAKKG